MTVLVDQLYLKLACETPLPGGSVTDSGIYSPGTTEPAKVERPVDVLPYQSLRSSVFSKKRGRRPSFSVYVDADVANTPIVPSPKRQKSNERVPLSVKSSSGNDTPPPSPRYADIPFPFSRFDPLWEDVQNYDARPNYMTPPPTPGGRSPTPSPSPSNPPLRNRSDRSRRGSASNLLPPPKDKSLYTILMLNDWKATREEIRAAYKRIAVESHPDKVAAEQRGDATRIMQSINAAKEVLLDDTCRRAYHTSGRLP